MFCAKLAGFVRRIPPEDLLHDSCEFYPAFSRNTEFTGIIPTLDPPPPRWRDLRSTENRKIKNCAALFLRTLITRTRRAVIKGKKEGGKKTERTKKKYRGSVLRA